MKKDWKEPKFEELNIKETAGGIYFNRKQDGEEWQKEGIWQIPVGTDKLSQSEPHTVG